MHCDASQAVGKLTVDVRALQVDFLSFTAHKFYGPKGIGALYVREAARPRIAAVQFGGGHERGLRSGTLPTHQVAGLWRGRPRWHGRSAERRRACARSGLPPGARAREHSGRALQQSPRDGAPGLVNASFEGIEGESLVTGLPEIAVSTGSACSSATREPSYVLRALGREPRVGAELPAAFPGAIHDGGGSRRGGQRHSRRGSPPAAIAGSAADIRPDLRRFDPDSSLATGNTLLGRTLNPATRHYFLAPHQSPRGETWPRRGVGSGRAGRLDGVAVTFELKIAAGIVKSARFSAYGCPHTLAVAAWLCEILEGVQVAAVRAGKPCGLGRKICSPGRETRAAADRRRCIARGADCRAPGLRKWQSH